MPVLTSLDLPHGPIPNSAFEYVALESHFGRRWVSNSYTGLYSFKNFQKTPANIRLRTMAFKTFLGSCCTLMSSIMYVIPPIQLPDSLSPTLYSNLSVLMALDGEPGWVCLMCCNCDGESLHPNPYSSISPPLPNQLEPNISPTVLFSAVVLQWVTSHDHAQGSDTSASASHRTHEELGDISRKRTLASDDRRNTPSEAALRRQTRKRRSSDVSNESSQVASSTKAIVDDVAEIFRDGIPRTHGRAGSEPRGGKTPTYEEVAEYGREHESVSPPLGPPEVHVHVDYRVTQKPAGAGEAAMGNTVTIGTGPGDDQVRRSRGNSRGLLNPPGGT